MKIFLILSILLFSIASKAAEDFTPIQTTKKWWTEQYQRVIKPQQKKEIQQEALKNCDTNIKRYTQKVENDPTSVYYKYKLDKWKKRCKQ